VSEAAVSVVGDAFDELIIYLILTHRFRFIRIREQPTQIPDRNSWIVEREIERVGSSQSISIDVRIIAATNRDLRAAVAEGTFRPDMFYRLSVFPIHMPALHERLKDIPPLVEHLVALYARKAGRTFRVIKPDTIELIQTHDWPGNIRELQNFIERAVILCEGDVFSIEEAWLKREATRPSAPTSPLAATLANREKEVIEAAIAESKGRVSGPTGAAARLGVPRQTLDSKIANLQISKLRFKPSSALPTPSYT
jgi:formate hydrogenlyase transcriptional activator